MHATNFLVGKKESSLNDSTIRVVTNSGGMKGLASVNIRRCQNKTTVGFEICFDADERSASLFPGSPKPTSVPTTDATFNAQAAVAVVAFSSILVG